MIKNYQNFAGIGFIKTWWYILAVLNLSSSISILVVHNNWTAPSNIWAEELVKKFESLIEWHQCNYSAISECINMNPNILIVLDLSDNFEVQLSLSQLCKVNQKTHLVAQKAYDSYYYDEWTYSIIPSKSTQMDAYFATLSYFNWTHGLVITDEDNIYSKKEFLDYSDTFDYLTIESSANIDKLGNRIIKPLGTTMYYIFTSSTISLIIQDMLISKKLLLKGDGIILNQNSGYGCTITEAFIVTATGQEFASTQEDSFLSSTENLIQYLLNSTMELTTIEGLKYLLKEYNKKNQFSIVNIKDSKREIVGSISVGIVAISDKLIFPGNTNVVPKSGKKILHMTVSGGSTNPGTPPYISISHFYYGSYVAWNLINQGTFGILKNFQIAYFIFDCGVANYDENFATACFTKDIDKFGLVHISAASSAMAIGEIKLFKKLNLAIPAIGATQLSYWLNSTAVYPLFTRVVVSNYYQFALSSLLLKALGWKKLCVLYGNDTLGSSGYSAFMENAEKYGLEILNPEDTRMLPENLNRTTIKNYISKLQRIIDTQGRLLVLLLQLPLFYFALEAFYDMGFRKGDIVILALSSDHVSLTQYDFLYTYKVKEAGIPMIAISGQKWVGETGKMVYSQIKTQYNTVPYSSACYFHDAAYTIGVALDYMINQGLDYYDPYQTNLAMRTQKFTGCTGTVSIDKNSNDRIMETFDINVNKIDNISGNITSYKMGEFHPDSATMLTIENPIIYGDGTTIKPDDLRNQNSKCPFSDKLVRTFTKGRILIFGVCFGFAFVSMAITAYIWKRWWNISLEELKEKQEISMQDYIVELTVLIEFFHSQLWAQI